MISKIFQYKCTDELYLLTAVRDKMVLETVFPFPWNWCTSTETEWRWPL